LRAEFNNDKHKHNTTNIQVNFG